MDALIQLLLTTEEIEFMNFDEMDLDTKIQIIALITLPLCYLLYKWGTAEDEDINKTRKR